MTQPPYPPSPAYPDPAYTTPRSNGWAVASLICGILGCVPLAQLLAIIFGIVGLSASRKTHSGKGMAVAGLVLGLIFTLIYAGCGGAGAVFWIKSKPVRLASHDFLQDAAAGRTDAALARCTSGVTAEEINTFAAIAASHGSISDITTFGVNVNSNMGGTAWETAGVVTFSDGQKVTSHLTLTSVADVYKVSKFEPDMSAISRPTTAAPAATNSALPSQTP